MPRKRPNVLPGLKLIRPTTWAAVYREWYRQEGRQPAWGRYLRQLGYSSWGAWRKDVIITPFKLQKKTWTLFHVSNPSVVMNWHGGPFPSWQKAHYRGAQTRSFSWLAKNGKVFKQEKIQKFKTLPPSMRFFGLRYKNRIIILDGMHRSCALAVKVARGQQVKTSIVIALAEITKLPKLKLTMV